MKFEKLIKENVNELNETDYHIYRYIRNNPSEITELSINKLAVICNTSRTSVLRFAQKLGLSGYSELKFIVKNDLQNRVKISNETIKEVYEDYTNSIKELMLYDNNEVSKLIYRSSRIFLVSSGATENHVAEEFKQMLFKTEKLAYLVYGSAETSALLRNITDEELVIVISSDGQDCEITEYCKALIEKKIPVVAICKGKQSKLAKICKYSVCYESSISQINVSKQLYHPSAMLNLLCENIFFRYLIYLEDSPEK